MDLLPHKTFCTPFSFPGRKDENSVIFYEIYGFLDSLKEGEIIIMTADVMQKDSLNNCFKYY